MKAFTPNRVGGPKRVPRRYFTQCKICRMGIYEKDVTVWLSSPLGLSHQECAP